MSWAFEILKDRHKDRHGELTALLPWRRDALILQLFLQHGRTFLGDEDRALMLAVARSIAAALA